MVNRDNQAKNKDPPDAAAPAMIERPKMSIEMWSAMKMHIMKQREKKKQELEADAAIERLRREQETKRKQDAMTLEEIKDQLSRFERSLASLKEEKHQLFLQLKKVLNEDETRRRAQVKEASEMVSVSHSYVPHGINLGVPSMYMPGQGQHVLNRAPMLYKGIPSPQNLIPPGAMKRPRSPSPPPPPPPHGAYHQNFNFKTHVTPYNQKPGLYPGNQFYAHPQGVQMTVSPVVSGTTGAPPPPPPTTASNYPQFSSQFGPNEQAASAKHIPHPGYHLSHIQQQNFVNSLQQIEQAKQEAARFPEEKYYVQQGAVVPIRGPSMIQIQQPSSKPSGSIITGYPVRPPVSAPQHFQPAPPPAGPQSQAHPHGTFVPQSGVSRMPYPNQTNQRYY